MDASERALASLLGADEELQETWTVDTINKGLSFSPPGMGTDETLGLTERRLLWLDDELESVAFDDLRDAKIETMQSGSSSAIVRLGVVALVFGVLTTAGLWLLSPLSTVVAVAPLAIGVGTLGLAAVTARLRDEDGEETEQHYLKLRTSRTTVQVFAEADTVAEIAERVESVRE